MITVNLGTRAEAKARKLLAEAQKKGADFAALVETHSEDELTRRRGGLLSRYAGRYGSEFDTAVEQMEPGSIRFASSTQGFHVLVLDSVARSEFAKVRDALAKEVRKQGVPEKEVRAYVKSLSDSAKVERL